MFRSSKASIALCSGRRIEIYNVSLSLKPMYFVSIFNAKPLVYFFSQKCDVGGNSLLLGEMTIAVSPHIFFSWLSNQGVLSCF